MADIPGLIEGAHAGHGLGHEFLRHVERTHLLVHLVEAVPLDGSDPLRNYRTIRNELAQYSPALAERPELLGRHQDGRDRRRGSPAAARGGAGPRGAGHLGRHRAGHPAAHPPDRRVAGGAEETGRRNDRGDPGRERRRGDRGIASTRRLPVAGPRPGHGRLGHAPSRRRPGKHPAQVGPARRDGPAGRGDRAAAGRPDGLGGGLVGLESPEAGDSWWAVSTVNPPVADRLEAFFEAQGIDRVTWIRSAAEVPVPKDVEGADSGGADRALAVFGATRLIPPGRPGLVVMCGTAITVERITPTGIWQGGAIAPGLGQTARALNLMTAQLPFIELCPHPAGLGTRHGGFSQGRHLLGHRRRASASS